MASALNQSVVQFAQQQLNNLVGRGECWDLAEEALSNAGAKTSNDIMGAKGITPTADYRWGTAIDLMHLAEGDIIQFRNFVATLTNIGSGISEIQKRPHHTAIVAKVWAHGCVDVYEQNVDYVKMVELHTLYLKAGTADGSVLKRTGQTWFYRPVEK